MTGLEFLILFSISCLISCEGAITSPPDGKKYLFLPGKTAKIKWEIDDPVSAIQFRTWSYKSSEGATPRILARIFVDGATDPQTNFLDFAIERPTTLVLNNVNQSYNGIYHFSYATSVTFSFKVEVSIENAPTVNLSCPGRNEVNEGNNFTCVCRAVGGVSPANVTWYKGGVQISETKLENNTLNLYDVNATDSGTYTCVAQSYPTEDFKDEKSCELMVLSKPYGTTITFNPQPVVVGDSVEIMCDSKGFPVPHFNIIRNGKKIKIGKSHTIKVNQSDEGPYTCIAINALGNDSATENLIVTDKRPSTKSPTKSSTKTPTKTQSTTPSSTSVAVATTTEPTTTTIKPHIGVILGGVFGGLFLLLIIVCVVVYCYKKKQKDRGSCGNIGPVAGNHYELDEDAGPADNAYDCVGPVGTSSSKSKPAEKNTLPPVYAAVDKNNRQGNTLYASLDTDAMKPKRESKKEPERTPQTEYASIDFAKRADDNVPKADLV